eukprot:354972-Chlamydomonas_euryale.AAC.4
MVPLQIEGRACMPLLGGRKVVPSQMYIAIMPQPGLLGTRMPDEQQDFQRLTADWLETFGSDTSAHTEICNPCTL